MSKEKVPIVVPNTAYDGVDRRDLEAALPTDEVVTSEYLWYWEIEDPLETESNKAHVAFSPSSEKYLLRDNYDVKNEMIKLSSLTL